MNIFPFFGSFAPVRITARQWQAAKMRPTQGNSNKNRPNNKKRLADGRKT